MVDNANIHVYDFIWDKVKSESNLIKHGVSFELATHVFQDPLALSVFDTLHSIYEERWLTIGLCKDGKLLIVSHTYIDLHENESQIRIISARFATIKERLYYENDLRQDSYHVH